MWTARPNPVIREHYHHLARSTVAQRVDTCHQQRRLDRESWRDLADAGLWRLAVPESAGGDGGSWWDFVAAFEGIATGGRDLGFCLSLVAHAGLVRSIVNLGTPAQQQHWLPRLLAGDVGATALTERTGGSDVARVRTQARREDQHGYRVTGEKAHITNGPEADISLILGRIPELGRHDITLFLVDLRSAGVSRGPAEDMLGNRTSPTGPIVLDDVRITQEHVVGQPGNGLEAVYNTISLDRLLYGILAAAYLEPVLDDLLEHAHHRQAFAQPIADYQYVQGRLTDIKFGIETTRWVSYGALGALLEDAPEASMMCSIAKYHAGETLRMGTENALRLLGHRGYMVSQDSRGLLDALGTLIAGGTAEMQRKNVFSQMVHLGSRDTGRLPQAA